MSFNYIKHSTSLLNFIINRGYVVGTASEMFGSPGNEAISGLPIDWLTLYVDVDYAFMVELPTNGQSDPDVDPTTIPIYGEQLLRYYYYRNFFFFFFYYYCYY
jgi:hypothetical protein